MRVIQFPKLKENQVALVHADYLTGIVLDIDLNVFRSEDQEEYIIFDPLDLAIACINENKFKTINIEYVVYNHLNEFIYRDENKGL